MELRVLKDKLMRGSLAGLVRVGLAIPLYLILTPFVLGSLGTELFGLWSFGTLIISVMTLTDFGFKNALVYHVASELERHDRINQHFNVAFFAYLLMALVALAVTIIYRDAIARDLLHIPAPLLEEAGFVLWVTAISFGLRFISISFQALLEAHQEHATVQMALLVWLISNFAGTVLALTLQPDIYALGLATLLSNLLVLGVFGWLVVRRYPYIRIGFRYLAGDVVKGMLRYGSGIQVATIIIAAREPLLKVLIARFYDLVSVATFEIVYKLCVQLVSVVITPLLGSFSASALLARNRQQELQYVLRPMFGFSLALFVPAVLFFVTFSKPLVALWLGPEYTQVAVMLPLAFTAFAIYYSTEILYKALEGAGMSFYSAIVQSSSILFSMAAFYIYVDDPGRAIPLALLAGFSIFSILNAWVFKWKFSNISLCEWSQWVWLLVPAVMYLVAQYWIANEVVVSALFAVYLLLHLLCVKKAQLFDFVWVARKIIGAVGVKS